MVYMLDTSVAIALRDGSGLVRERMEDLRGAILLSIIVRVELEGGVFRDLPEPQLRQARLQTMLANMPTVPFDDVAADAYRAIVAQLGYSRRKILDRMIASQAIVEGATLITLNGNDFRDIPDLKLLEW